VLRHNSSTLPKYRNRDSSVSIVTELRSGRPEFDCRQEQKFVLFATAFRTSLVSPQPPTQMGNGVKRPGCEADHSPPTSTEIKNAWNYTAIHPYIFMGWCLIKHRTRLHGLVLNKDRANFTLPAQMYATCNFTLDFQDRLSHGEY